MTAKRWMHNWQARFKRLEIDLIVADISPSSVIVNVAEGTIVLAPHLSIFRAEKVLEGLYGWWQNRMEDSQRESYSLVSC
jgi:hypothetical protein